MERIINQNGNEDNISVSSQDSDNTLDFTHSENNFKEHVRQFAAHVKSSISDMINHMQQRFQELENMSRD